MTLYEWCFEHHACDRGLDYVKDRKANRETWNEAPNDWKCWLLKSLDFSFTEQCEDIAEWRCICDDLANRVPWVWVRVALRVRGIV